MKNSRISSSSSKPKRSTSALEKKPVLKSQSKKSVLTKSISQKYMDKVDAKKSTYSETKNVLKSDISLSSKGIKSSARK